MRARAPVTYAPLQTFGHPGEAWGYAVGVGAKFVNFLLPKDMIEFQVNYCHGATAYCFIPGLYSWNWLYVGGNTVGSGYAVDGVFTNDGQIQLTDDFSSRVGYQHYWSPQWRTAVVGGQTLRHSTTAVLQARALRGGSGQHRCAKHRFSLGTLTGATCSPNFSQTAVSTRTAWNPHPFLEIGLDLIWYHLTRPMRAPPSSSRPTSVLAPARYLPGEGPGQLLHGPSLPEEHPALIVKITAPVLNVKTPGGNAGGFFFRQAKSHAHADEEERGVVLP